ncbi:MAG: ATP-binding protein [Saprospiraceae bacterium]
MIPRTRLWQEANQQYLNTRIFRLLKDINTRLNPCSERTNIPYDTNTEWNEPEPPHLEVLVNKFNLSPFEQNILLIAAGIELSSSFRKELLKLLELENNELIPLYAAFRSLENPHWSAVSPDAPLRKWNLIKIFETGILMNRNFSIDEAILHYLTGLPVVEESNGHWFSKLTSEARLSDTQLNHSDFILETLENKRSSNSIALVCDNDDKICLALACAQYLKKDIYRIHAFALPEHHEEVALLAKAWNRFALLNDLILYVDTNHADLQNSNSYKTLQIFLSLINSICLIGLNSNQALFDKSTRIEILHPFPHEQQKLWKQALGVPNATPPILEFVKNYDFSASDIHQIAQEFQTKSQLNTNASNKPQLQLFRQICSRNAQPDLGHLATCLECKSTWKDLVLSPETFQSLQEIAHHVHFKNEVFEINGFSRKMARSQGIAVLFAGESGTGKTMAAEVLANELQLDLYRIDLSQLVNKYIGETEKNIKRIFDAAESGGCILLFDEADAIFGKRSEVKDSHDRYSNIQVGYLLQRMETFNGVAILTTNMRHNFDKAFERRFRFILQFDRPNLELRKIIWQKVFPPEMPIEDISYDKLARINLPGGNIKNIALHAAFLAAADGKKITMKHLANATRNEFAKIERNLVEHELKDWI